MLSKEEMSRIRTEKSLSDLSSKRVAEGGGNANLTTPKWSGFSLGVNVKAETGGEKKQSTTASIDVKMDSPYVLVGPGGEGEIILGLDPRNDPNLHGDPRHLLRWLTRDVVNSVHPGHPDVAIPLCRIEIEDPTRPVEVTATLYIDMSADHLFPENGDAVEKLALDFATLNANTIAAHAKLRRRVANMSALKPCARQLAEDCTPRSERLALASRACIYWPASDESKKASEC
jgi:hypothetical protein